VWRWPSLRGAEVVAEAARGGGGGRACMESAAAAALGEGGDVGCLGRRQQGPQRLGLLREDRGRREMKSLVLRLRRRITVAVLAVLLIHVLRLSTDLVGIAWSLCWPSFNRHLPTILRSNLSPSKSQFSDKLL
jgi:hypothetical protein